MINWSICLNWGCIPTKALLRASEINHIISETPDFGINVKNFSIDWKTIVSRSRKVSEQLSKGVDYLLKKNFDVTLNLKDEPIPNNELVKWPMSTMDLFQQGLIKLEKIFLKI